eukprot:m.205512 g.205512  ORF g.205512 m.205512 type:complete len:425 (+) comp22969_c0_seq1:138-1412(+)
MPSTSIRAAAPPPDTTTTHTDVDGGEVCTPADQEAEAVARIPKVELHRHLEGSVAVATVLDEARRNGVWLPHGPQGTLTDPHACTLEGIAPHLTATAPFPDLATVLDKFHNTQKVLTTIESFRRIAKEAVLHAADEGIVALELRYAPSFAAAGHDHPFDRMHDAILAGVVDGKRHLCNSGRPDIAVGLIIIAVPGMGERELDKTIDFVLANRRTIVGFDTAGEETDPTRWTRNVARLREAGVPMTWHASECPDGGPPKHAVAAVENVGAARIGHGIQIVHDPDAVARVREAGALLEICITSNWLTSGVASIASHPVRRLWEAGIRVCPNTDDPCIMAIDARSEWELWRAQLGWLPHELEALNVIALSRSFLPHQEKERVYATFFSGTPKADGSVYPPLLEGAVAWAEAVHNASIQMASTSSESS